MKKIHPLICAEFRSFNHQEYFDYVM